MLLLLHKTLKGGRNIQGFALIRAVLIFFIKNQNDTFRHFRHLDIFPQKNFFKIRIANAGVEDINLVFT